MGIADGGVLEDFGWTNHFCRCGARWPEPPNRENQPWRVKHMICTECGNGIYGPKREADSGKGE